ncbi:hypothetical protein D7Z54_20905 [Salibacterium salarium]|uniref:Uncharacterized protein n=1 Tax=Salibacterium salarium TaxID=284579 RepID=A0A428MZH7_9BACI|nr:hypothetical protein D7Z54_20905 [Salibacterium salarium]
MVTGQNESARAAKCPERGGCGTKRGCEGSEQSRTEWLRDKTKVRGQRNVQNGPLMGQIEKEGAVICLEHWVILVE